MAVKFYPSSSAFMLGDQVVTKYDSGCLRSILVKASGVDTGNIPALYERCGKQAEDDLAASLKANGHAFVSEMVLKTQLSENVEYSGRADFVVHGPDGTVVYECKGHTSKTTRLEVIRNGKYNVGYLAQLTSYMVRLRTGTGYLVCGYYEENEDGALVRQEGRTFAVDIDDDGGINVDGSPSGYSVADLLAHQRAAVDVLETKTVAARPADWQMKFTGPCRFCPFKAACDYYDVAGGTAYEFIRAAADCVVNAPPRPEPVANKIKIPKPRKESKRGSTKVQPNRS